MNFIVVDQKKYKIHGKLHEITEYDHYQIVFTSGSIIFINKLSFTIYLANYMYHVSNKHGIFYKEKYNDQIFQITNPYQQPKPILNTSSTFIGLIEDEIVLFNKNTLSFYNLFSASTNTMPICENPQNIIIYNNLVVITIEYCILFIHIIGDYIRHEKFSFENSGCVYFYKFFLHIDDYIFLNDRFVGRNCKDLVITEFEEKLVLCMLDDEQFKFFNLFYATNENFDSVLNGFIASKETMLNIEHLILSYAICGKLCDIKNSLFDKTAFFELNEMENKTFDKIFAYLNKKNVKRKVFNYDSLFCKIKMKTFYNKIVKTSEANEVVHVTNTFKLDVTNSLPYKIITYNERNKNIKIDKTVTNEINDARLTEVSVLLDDQVVGDFEYDEFDLEKKRENSYINRISANIGKAFFMFKCCDCKGIYKIKDLKFKVKKEKPEIIETSKSQKNWPDFIFSCNSYLTEKSIQKSIIEFDDENENELRNKKNTKISLIFPFSGFDHNYALAGALFALGINGEVTEECFYHYYFSTKEIVIFASILGYCISNKGSTFSSIAETLKTNIFENDSYLVKLGSILGLSFLFQETNCVSIISIIKKECNRNGVFYSDQNRNHRQYCDNFYRLFSTFSLALIIKDNRRFINLKDSLCELILNGILFAGSKNYRIVYELKRKDDCRLEELFYSNLFINLIMFDQKSSDVLQEINIENLSNNDLTLTDLYKISGKIFYIAFKELHTKSIGLQSESDINRILYNICLQAEEKMLDDLKYKILFDSLLITLSLINNGTCNLDILRIIRRLIKKTERSKHLDKIDFFSIWSSKDETTYGLYYGDNLKYKMCLGVLCCGMGKKHINFGKSSILNIVASFFINFPLTSADQDFFNVLRYFICFDIRDKNEINEVFMHTEMDLQGFKDINEFFKFEIAKADEIGKKAMCDILCDYFEKNDNYIQFDEFIKES
ncbi:hypothetical protein COBT_002340, partial [Conglomerata obtusa]